MNRKQNAMMNRKYKKVVVPNLSIEQKQSLRLDNLRKAHELAELESVQPSFIIKRTYDIYQRTKLQ